MTIRVNKENVPSLMNFYFDDKRYTVYNTLSLVEMTYLKTIYGYLI